MTMPMEHPLEDDRCSTNHLSDVCDEAVGLLMTYRCNLDCTYCYISKKQDLDMTLEIAKNILRPLLSKSGGIVDITFMGAETLMAESVIRPLVEWAEAGTWRRLFRFLGSTNGTLLTGELKRWLTRHRHSLVLGLSYDGLPSVQQSNRGCASEIDVDFFIQTWPMQPVQMTINSSSVSQMAEGVIYLLERGAIVHPNVAYERTQWNKKAIAEYGRQLNRLIDYYIQHSDRPRIMQFTHNLTEYALNLETDSVQPEMCGAGNGFQVFDVDGSSYPCHLLSPLVLAGEKLEMIKSGKLDQTTDFSDPRCRCCPYRSACSTCLACNYIYRDSFQKRDATHCEIMRMDVKAFVKMEVLRLSAQNKFTPEDALEVKAIHKLIQYDHSANTRKFR